MARSIMMLISLLILLVAHFPLYAASHGPGTSRPAPSSDPLIQLLRAEAARLHPLAAAGRFRALDEADRSPGPVSTVPGCDVVGQSWQGSTTSRLGFPENLLHRAHGLEEAYRILAATPVGRDLLALRSREGMPAIAPLDAATRAKLQIPDSQAADYSVSDHKIYVDEHAELGLLAIDLFHEMVHSLDRDYESESLVRDDLYRKEDEILKATTLRAARRANKSVEAVDDNDFEPDELSAIERIMEQRQKLEDLSRFHAERLAYDAERVFMRELALAYPCAVPYFAAHIANGELARYPSDGDLIRGYGLNPKYFVGLPFTRL